MSTRKWIVRCAEELCPFPFCYANIRKSLLLCDAHDLLGREPYEDYPSLPTESLAKRLKEEHLRATSLDEKTSKLTLSLSIALTALGLAVAFFRTSVSSEIMQGMLLSLIGRSVFYALGAGCVALGAFRTMRTYGYGTQFLLVQQSDPQAVLALNLARQEIMNTVRHIRNETAFQALRNGLLLLCVCVGVLMVALTWASFSHASASKPLEDFANTVCHPDRIAVARAVPHFSFDESVFVPIDSAVL